MTIFGYLRKHFVSETATSMLVTDVEDKICYRQLWDDGDGFRRFCHQHPLSLSISVGHQPIISDKSPTNLVPNIRHQHACSKSHQFNDSAKSGIKNRRYITIKAGFLGQQSVSDNWTWIFIITWYYPVSKKISRSVRHTDILTSCNPYIKFWTLIIWVICQFEWNHVIMNPT